MGRPKKETVTVSFHYLMREGADGGDEEIKPFTQEDFENLLKSIAEQPMPDMTNQSTFERVRYGSLVPFSELKRKNARCAFGKFKAPYSGHSFENSEKGKITADSVNQRTFNYLLYLSNNGRIYVGAQYLGNYGGWLPLSGAIKKFLGQPSKIASASFRNELAYLEGASPKEIEVSIHRQPDKISADPSLVRKTKISFQREEKGDQFEQDTKDNLFPLFGKNSSTIKKELVKSLKKNGLTEISDDEITDCVMIAEVNGKEKRFYFLDQINIATRFPIDVSIDKDGHPDTDQTQDKMYKLLEKEIISKIASV
jgi:hypothetical protein